MVYTRIASAVFHFARSVYIVLSLIALYDVYIMLYLEGASKTVETCGTAFMFLMV